MCIYTHKYTPTYIQEPFRYSMPLIVDVIALPGSSFACMRLLKVSRPLLHIRSLEQFQKTVDSICCSFQLLPPIIRFNAQSVGLFSYKSVSVDILCGSIVTKETYIQQSSSLV